MAAAIATMCDCSLDCCDSRWTSDDPGGGKEPRARLRGGGPGRLPTALGGRSVKSFQPQTCASSSPTSRCLQLHKYRRQANRPAAQSGHLSYCGGPHRHWAADFQWRSRQPFGGGWPGKPSSTAPPMTPQLPSGCGAKSVSLHVQHHLPGAQPPRGPPNKCCLKIGIATHGC